MLTRVADLVQKLLYALSLCKLVPILKATRVLNYPVFAVIESCRIIECKRAIKLVGPDKQMRSVENVQWSVGEKRANN